MANVKVTQDKNGVRWLELMRSGSGTLLEIRNKEEALQIITALQQSVQSDLATGFRTAIIPCPHCGVNVTVDSDMLPSR